MSLEGLIKLPRIVICATKNPVHRPQTKGTFQGTSEGFFSHPPQLKTCSGSYLATWVCILRITAVSTTVTSAPVFHRPPEISQVPSVLLRVTSKDVPSVAEIAMTLVTKPNACFWIAFGCWKDVRVAEL